MTTFYDVGDGKTYSSIQAAIDVIPGNLLGTGIHHVRVYPKAAGYQETIDAYSGFTNAGPLDYIDIEAMVLHGGLRGNGIVLDPWTTTKTVLVDLVEQTRFHGFCCTHTSHVAGGTIGVVVTRQVDCQVYDNLIYDMDADSTRTIRVIFKLAPRQQIYNNMVFGIGRGYSGLGTGSFATGIAIQSDGNPITHDLIANNTIYDVSFQGIGGGIRNYIDLYNNYVGGCPTDYFLTLLNSNREYNISSDGTSGTGTNLINKPAANQFQSVTQGNENLHLKSGADCRRTGQDLSTFFTTDIDGQTRVDWNTGADEFTGGIIDATLGAAQMMQPIL